MAHWKMTTGSAMAILGPPNGPPNGPPLKRSLNQPIPKHHSMEEEEKEVTRKSRRIPIAAIGDGLLS